jgi:hypothetical protein
MASNSTFLPSQVMPVRLRAVAIQDLAATGVLPKDFRI